MYCVTICMYKDFDIVLHFHFSESGPRSVFAAVVVCISCPHFRVEFEHNVNMAKLKNNGNTMMFVGNFMTTFEAMSIHNFLCNRFNDRLS